MYNGVEKYKFAIEQFSIVAITDLRGIITYVNQKFCDLSKYSKNELLGQTHRIVNSGHHSQAFFVDMWRTIGKGDIWRGEIKNKAKDGTYYWVDTTIVPMLDNDGKIKEYFSIRIDITDRKVKELELLDVNQKLIAQHEQLLHIAYANSHQVRMPLANILGLVALLGMDETSLQEKKEIIEKIKISANNLDKAVLELNNIIGNS